MASNNQKLRLCNTRIELTKDTKIYLLSVLKNGHINTDEFQKAFGNSLAIIDDPFAWIRYVHDINNCPNCGKEFDSKVE